MDLLRRIRKAGAILALVGWLPAAGLAPIARGEAVPNEYTLKSVFLYNFIRFIDWPETAFGGRSAPLIIGVLGQDPFGPLLDEAVQGETFRGRPILIEHYRGPREIRRCHLLFVGAAEGGGINEVLAAVAGESTVTVGETEDFVARGGMIALITDRNRVRLVINPDTLRGAKLEVSSKLLRVADIKN